MSDAANIQKLIRELDDVGFIRPFVKYRDDWWVISGTINVPDSDSLTYNVQLYYAYRPNAEQVYEDAINKYEASSWGDYV